MSDFYQVKAYIDSFGRIALTSHLYAETFFWFEPDNDQVIYCADGRVYETTDAGVFLLGGNGLPSHSSATFQATRKQLRTAQETGTLSLSYLCSDFTELVLPHLSQWNPIAIESAMDRAIVLKKASGIGDVSIVTIPVIPDVAYAEAGMHTFNVTVRGAQTSHEGTAYTCTVTDDDTGTSSVTVWLGVAYSNTHHMAARVVLQLMSPFEAEFFAPLQTT